MTDLIVGILAFFGTIFIFLAAVGLLRMPDTYLRISVTTKAATLGIGLLLVAAAVYFKDLSITTRVMAILLFILLTAPVSAHLIGRTSYFSGIRLWKGSVMDDLEGKYQRISGVLKSETDDTPEDNIVHDKDK
ncbi:monovalent cation/H(+) antiporter subunit G [Gillisia sp. M10.2A]|uniref:Monovalent cation/H(+) antiporter subunit G n=1 Tax=Gillisia lutea TaxID=2909668 RepID=A0ABS9EC55_9FLAO|nr:monovalent cation/H(+) antiporter subunit G [Gillisia lutea]MCF4100463.1 monovalent cation/H(+) antiporter subunit G [Gillisia lutea]